MTVPFLDLKVQYQSIQDEIRDALQAVLDKTAFASGPFVAEFEEEFARYCGCEHCVGVASGTDALWAALLALGVGQGDEVITVPNTFIATAEAISFVGATPVFVDVDERTYTMDPARVADAITPKTKAIIPVHLYGQMADMDPIMEVARAHDLCVVEDAAQAHGARYKDRPAGSIGDAGCYSFYPGKNLGAYGEAGAVVTNNAEIAATMRQFRDHGQAKKYYHSIVGWNSRMDGFQGAVLKVKLAHLEEWTEGRRANARKYAEALEGVEGVLLPLEADYARHVYHIYAVHVADRQALADALSKDGIASGIHYPVPIHLQEAYGAMGLGAGSFPVAERLADQELSLPMFAELTDEQIQRVADGVKRFAQQ